MTQTMEELFDLSLHVENSFDTRQGSWQQFSSYFKSHFWLVYKKVFEISKKSLAVFVFTGIKMCACYSEWRQFEKETLQAWWR